jgi:hypothetical protein
MPSLRTVSVERLIRGPLQTICTCLERSVSLEEKTTLMEVLISMFSSTSDDAFDPDEPNVEEEHPQHDVKKEAR